MRVLLLAIGLTFALGLSLAAAAYVVGGPLALQGSYVWKQSLPAIYTLMAVSAAAVTAPLGFAIPEVNGRMVAVVIGAWLGEYLVLASGLLDDDLNPANAVFIWITATGGPVQPVAAFTGAVIGGWLIYRYRSRA